MSEIQACLTNDPNDKEPLHKKQPIAASNGEIWKSLDDSTHSVFSGTKSSVSESFLPELVKRVRTKIGYVEVHGHARKPVAGNSTKVAFEPFPMVTEYEIAGTTYQITHYHSSFGRRMGARFLSLRARLNHIFQARASTHAT